jgi:hypothetical protein
MLPPDVSATCGVWTPDDQQASGCFFLILIDSVADLHHVDHEKYCFILTLFKTVLTCSPKEL